MPDADPSNTAALTPRSRGYDAIVVGASLAGCSTAILLGRVGARVALVEKQPAERTLMAAAARDPRVAAGFDAYATRLIKPGRMLARIAPRAVAVHARRSVDARRAAGAARAGRSAVP
jgi:2-polyprenyl-6-methoxyphenol hydroxylase-like FAD-dependent oxidoreductase